MSASAYARKVTIRLGLGCLVPAGACATVWLGLLFSSSARAAEPLGGPSLSAEDLVQEALAAEVDGRSRDRDRWIHEALKQSPDHPAAHWLAGQVLVGGHWVKIEEAPSLAAGDSKLQEYLRVRSKYGDNVPDQLRLGDWCRERGLTEQARAHFTRVIELDPDHAVARNRLGYRRIHGEWYSAAEVQEFRSRAKQLKNDLDRWRPAVQKVRQSLSASVSAGEERARKQLRTMDVPGAVPALELLLAPASQQEASLAIEAIGRIPGPEASVALARLAAFAQWGKARRQAAKQLKSRPLVEFVPPMLAAMSTPLELVSWDFVTRPHSAAMTLRFSNENQDVTKVTEASTTVARDLVRAGDVSSVPPAFLITPVPPPMLLTPYDRRDLLQPCTLAERYNLQIVDLNARITRVLNDVTDQELSSDPTPWWSWWDQYNDVTTSAKPVVRTCYHSYLHRPAFSCFAAGTPVWTIDGPRPIEKIAVGDLVLAQNVETGELAYKPVLRTTLREPADLLVVKAGEDTFQCTGGHNFWVPGSGWTRTRKLDPPTRVHGVAGAVEVTSIQPGPTKRTRNLVVADFNTYFVGKEKLLVHDVTLPAPTPAEVPGQKTP
jgi:tetratricopeptide (TPR) repeat protein